MGKVHGSLARAGKVKGQTPKIDKIEKKKQPRGRCVYHGVVRSGVAWCVFCLLYYNIDSWFIHLTFSLVGHSHWRNCQALRCGDEGRLHGGCTKYFDAPDSSHKEPLVAQRLFSHAEWWLFRVSSRTPAAVGVLCGGPSLAEGSIAHVQALICGCVASASVW